MLEGSQQNDLIINLSKCQFGWQEIDFLGQGAIPLPSKVATIKELTKPSTIKGLQDLFGMVHFYHRLVPAAANLMQPLFLALTVKPMELWWNEEMSTAFNFAKEARATRVCLHQGVLLLVSLAAETPCCHI